MLRVCTQAAYRLCTKAFPLARLVSPVFTEKETKP